MGRRFLMRPYRKQWQVNVEKTVVCSTGGNKKLFYYRVEINSKVIRFNIWPLNWQFVVYIA